VTWFFNLLIKFSIYTFTELSLHPHREKKESEGGKKQNESH